MNNIAESKDLETKVHEGRMWQTKLPFVFWRQD